MMLNPKPMTVRFWGVRGSYPTPGQSTLRYGGNTACISVHFNGYTLILDAGTGIIQLGRELVRQSQQDPKALAPTLLFSHYHHDHTQGFPFFAPTRLPNAHISVFGPRLYDTGSQEVLEQVLTLPLFPLQLQELDAQIDYGLMDGGDVLLVGDEVGGIVRCGQNTPTPQDPQTGRVMAFCSSEHPNQVMHYRIEWCGRSIVYATDREGPMDPNHPLVDFSHHADLLIHDSQYTQAHYEGLTPGLPATRGFGHSTVAMACEVAQLAEVGRLALFHLDPSYSDDQMDQIVTDAQAVFPNTIGSREGLELVFEPCEKERE